VKKVTTDMQDNCRSCNARIVWGQDQDGTRMPFNYVRVRAYRYEGLMAPDFQPIFKKSKDLYFISHFKTCPDASSWGKGGKP